MTLRLAALKAWPRGAMMALAALALAVKLLVPQGYMAAEPGAGAGFALVICTAEGRITLDAGDKPAPAKPKADGACAFAGNITPPAPPALVLTGFDAGRVAPPSTPGLADQLPGRGLAAPPPPAVGPPVLI